MSDREDWDEIESPEDDPELTILRLQGLRDGIGAFIMPVTAGWRIHYFSSPAFDEEPGTDFPTFQKAMAAIADVLLAVNTEEEKERAREDLAALLQRTGTNEAAHHQST